jgi:hypothetical protein
MSSAPGRSAPEELWITPKPCRASEEVLLFVDEPLVEHDSRLATGAKEAALQGHRRTRRAGSAFRMVASYSRSGLA